jgi:acyl-CoA reductase-like NAD-dependent aldehyde dehydrogenase
MAYTLLEPAGVVVALSAFNHPLNLIIHQVVPAVAVGCPVIVKPASATPLSCFSIVKLLHEAGLPTEWATALLCENELAATMAADSRIAFVTFIGSARVGWNIRRNLAPGVRSALEHGGAAPVIIEPDADLDAVLPGIVKGGYYHAGQVCVSVQRVYAHTSVMQEVKEKMRALVEKLTVGDPLDAATEVGPLIAPREVDRVAEWVGEAVREGAELLAGGNKVSKTCFEPTLLANPPLDAKVSVEEVFGPVVNLYEYEDYRDAVDAANRLPFTFQASVFTRNIDVALDCVKRLKGTAVMVNEHTAFRVDWMPFGGAEPHGHQVGVRIGGDGRPAFGRGGPVRQCFKSLYPHWIEITRAEDRKRPHMASQRGYVSSPVSGLFVLVLDPSEPAWVGKQILVAFMLEEGFPECFAFRELITHQLGVQHCDVQLSVLQQI